MKKCKVFSGGFYLLKYVSTLNVPVFRSSSLHRGKLLNDTKKKKKKKKKHRNVLKRSLSLPGFCFKFVRVISVPKFIFKLFISFYLSINLSIYINFYIIYRVWKQNIE